MYGLTCLNSANLVFTATDAAITAVSPYPRRLLRFNSALRSIAFTHSSHRRAMDTPSPAATAGIDDFVNVGEGGKILGEDEDTLPENESAIGDSLNTYERKVLPPELSRSVAVLTCESAADGGVCDIYLVGTAHVSTVIRSYPNVSVLIFPVYAILK